MQAASDAVCLQQRLCIRNVDVVQGARDCTGQWCCAVVYKTGQKHEIMHDALRMCVVAMHDVPEFMQDAVWTTFNSKISKVVVWRQDDRTFYDVAHRKLATVRETVVVVPPHGAERLRVQRVQAHKHADYRSLLEFWRKIQDEVERTTTLTGTWCQMRFGDAGVQTSEVTRIAGTIVMCRQAEHVIDEMRSELLEAAYPLYPSDTNGAYKETFADAEA